MNLKVLPPKRFEDPYDPYFDPIRHESWYPKLLKRRAKNNVLRVAHTDMMVNAAAKMGYTQKFIADHYGVDPRELRDYINWVNKTPRRAPNASEQAILDGAYEYYCFDVSDRRPCLPFNKCIRYVASLFGVKGRPIEELWETNPDFVPTGYPRR